MYARNSRTLAYTLVLTCLLNFRKIFHKSEPVAVSQMQPVTSGLLYSCTVVNIAFCVTACLSLDMDWFHS